MVFGDASNVSRLTPAFQRRVVEGEYWLVNDTDARLAALLANGASADSPAAILIPLDQNFAARAEAAARLWRLAMGRPSRRSPDHPTQHQRRRLVLSLRALDGHLAGETYREIARVLFGVTRIPAGPAWKTHDLRDRTIRLVRTGLDLMQGGYLDLLRHSRRRHGK
jgi:hypothetical protein